MKALWFAVATLFFANFAAAQSPAAEPSPLAIALAQRYMAATGGTYELILQQSYVAAGILGDTPTSHARQRAMQQATDEHRNELTQLDVALASLVARTFTQNELVVAVNFLESSAGRSVTVKKHAYFAEMFTRDRPPLTFTPEENSALAAFGQTPEAISMSAKTPSMMAQTLALSTPVQQAIQKSAAQIYCHASPACINGGDDFDRRAGPSIREP